MKLQNLIITTFNYILAITFSATAVANNIKAKSCVLQPAIQS